MQSLEVSFALTIAPEAYERIAADVAPAYAQVPGLRWKIWLLDREIGEARNVYLFDDAASLSAFLAGPLATALRAAPFLRDLRVRRLELLPGVTAVTRGPIAGVQVDTPRAAVV
jgi:hypothetical protein